MEKLIKGADLSTLLEVEECGGKFYDDGIEGGAMEILKSHGASLVRLRLWNDPYGPGKGSGGEDIDQPCDMENEPYGAGACDLPRVMKLASRAKALGLSWMLDFHYSDFWADPGKQIIPKAWQGLDEEALEREVYYYTRDVLLTLRAHGLLPSYVAVGNEITAGLLWPHGKRQEAAAAVPADGESAGKDSASEPVNAANERTERPGMIRLLNAGIRAVRQAAPSAKVLLHLDNGGNNALYRDWFGSYFAQGGEDFDIIGLSYYPYWHGTLEDLRNNLTDLAERYHKPMMIVETAMAFTYEDHQLEDAPDDAIHGTEESAPEAESIGQESTQKDEPTGAELSPEEKFTETEQPVQELLTQRKPLAAGAELGKELPWPGTPQGQVSFLRDLTEVLRSVPGDLCLGFIWWEAAWIPVPGSGWATEAALEYLHDKGPGGNEWANMTLFDYDGNALPALKALKEL